MLKMVAREQRQRQLAGSTGVEREALKAVPQPPPHTAIVISGARRCGKSTLLLQIMRKRYRQGNFAYFDFDDERVEGLEADDLQRVLEALYEEGGEPIAFFFDEIQNAPSWELFVSRLLKEGKDIYITGSNSRLLAGELGSRLTGRHLDVRLLPFSFREFLSGRGVAARQGTLTTKERSALRRAFDEYLAVGGFPRAALDSDTSLLRPLYEDILVRDIISRHRVAKVGQLRQAGRFLLSNIARLSTLRAVSEGFSMSVATAMKYLGYFEEAWLLFAVGIYSRSHKVQTRNPRKIYAVDWGLAAANGFFQSHDIGRKLENAVAVHLLRQGKEFFYYRTSGGREVDFVACISGRPEELVQVCADPSDSATRRREEDAILEAKAELGVKKALVLTLDFEALGKIEYLPAWKWVLR